MAAVAKSKRQIKFFQAVVRAQQSGRYRSPRLARVAQQIKPQDAQDYANTNPDGLPYRVRRKKPVMRKIRESAAKKWIKVHKSREGMFNGKSQADLEKMKAALKKSNDAAKERGEKVSEKNKTKMAQINFALRAKKGHGIHESQHDLNELLNDYYNLKQITRLDEETMIMLDLLGEELAYVMEGELLDAEVTQLNENAGDDLDDETPHPDEQIEATGGMAKEELYNAGKAAINLFKMIEEGEQIEPWVFYKITLACDYLTHIEEYLSYEKAKQHELANQVSIPDDDNYMESLSHKLSQHLDEAKKGVRAMKFTAKAKGTIKKDDDKPSKPRNFVAKNASATIGGGGAGAHTDKKKASKQGYEKHKGKEVAEDAEEIKKAK